MAKIFIIHGVQSSPNSNWFPWLKNHLVKLGNKVEVPQFPTPKPNTYISWKNKLLPYKSLIDEDTIFVCHSLGCPFILKFLEEHDKKIKACFLVAPFYKPVKDDDINLLNKTFYTEFDWNKIKRNCDNFTIYGSQNDPYISISQPEFMAMKLSAKLNYFKNAGHFSVSTNPEYKEFMPLLEDIVKIL